MTRHLIIIVMTSMFNIAIRGQWLFTLLLLLLMEIAPLNAQDKWANDINWVYGNMHDQPWQCLKVIGHILQRDSTQAEAYYLKARIIRKWGWWQETIRCFEAALHYHPAWLKNETLMSNKYSDELAAKEYNKAQATVDQLLKHYPKETLYHSFKVNTYIKQEQYQLALKSLDNLISLEPNKSIHHDRKASVYIYLKNYQLALQEYQSALKKSPLDKEAKPEEYRQHIKDMQTNLQYRTDEQQKQASLDKRIAAKTAQIKATPQDFELYWERASLYSRRKLYLEAVQDYRHIMTLDLSQAPQDRYFWMLQNKAEAEGDLGLLDQALTTISIPLEKTNHANTFLLSRYSIYDQARKYDQAIVDIDTLVKRQPKNGTYWFLRANTKRRMGDYLGALKDYEMAAKFGSPGIPADIRECKVKAGIIFDREILQTELSRLYSSNHLDTLFVRLDTYQQQRPQEKLIYYYRALAYAQYHKYDLARENFQKALEIAPEYWKDLDFMMVRAKNLQYGKYYTQALKAYQDIQKNITGQLAYTCWQMGKIYVAMEDYINAYAQLNTATHWAKDPFTRMSIYFDRGTFYLYHFDNYEKAVKDLEEVSKTAAGLAQEPLAEARELVQILKTADEIEEQLKNPSVKHRDSLLVKRAQLLYEASYFGAAWKDFEAATKINPDLMDDLEFAFYWADTGHLGKMKYPQVIEILKKAIALHPKDDDLLALLGRVYLVTKQYQKSVDAYDVMIEQTQQLDDYIEVMAERGKAKVGLKDYEGAWKDFMAYLEDNPSLEYFIEKELKICREKLKKD